MTAAANLVDNRSIEKFGWREEYRGTEEDLKDENPEDGQGEKNNPPSKSSMTVLD